MKIFDIIKRKVQKKKKEKEYIENSILAKYRFSREPER